MISKIAEKKCRNFTALLIAISVCSCIFWKIRNESLRQYDDMTVRSSETGVKTPSLMSPDATVSRDKSWRQTNRLVANYRQDIAKRLEVLASRKTVATDQAVIQLVRDIIDPVPLTAAIGIKKSRDFLKTPQTEHVVKITNHKRDGFFIECGALDGERSSNTIWLEKNLGWTGLLIEMDPFYYTQLLGKNRRALSANACLSPRPYITMLPFRGTLGGTGHLVYVSKQKATSRDASIPCFPLESFLAAINQTHIDYFSLDVEGAELDVLKTIPFDRIDIDILSVEYVHGRDGKKAYSDFMESKGYSVRADIHDHRIRDTLFVDDFIFVKK